MMGELDGLGDAVTGSLLARAVEPAAGEAGDPDHTHERACLNCATRLAGSYCHACGQKAHVHRTLRGFIQDFLQGLFNFEGKIWRTLPMLAWCPGDLTRRYVTGERARFISPVALYLFTVFAMFAVLNLTGTFSPGASPIGGVGLEQGLKAEIAADEAALTELRAKRSAAATSGKNLANFDRQIARREQDIAANRKVLSGEVFTSELGDDTPAWLRPLAEQAKENPELLMTKIQDAASKFSWLLIPLSVPFLWLLFPLRQRRLYDHTVFVTYSLSFMMILVILGGVLVAAGAQGVAGFLFFVPPFHMYRQLKGAYQLSRLGALVRTALLVTFAFVAAILFLVSTVAIGLL